MQSIRKAEVRYDENLENRLNHWAAWVIKINCGESGYPSKSTMYDIYRMGGYVGKSIPKSTCLLQMSKWADEMNGLINRLKTERPVLSEAIYLHYTTRLNKKTLAKEIGVSPRTLRERVKCGKDWLSDELSKNT
jgi:hypothetical protein